MRRITTAVISVLALVLIEASPSGARARHRTPTKCPPAGSQVLHALDKTGERTLAVGSNIDPNSLALAGSTLYWTQSGRPALALLN
jgi:hypothetical protein